MTAMTETRVQGVKTVAAGVIVYLTRYNIDSTPELVDDHGFDYALLLEQDLKDVLELQGIHARIRVDYKLEDEPDALDTIILNRTADEKDTLEAIVDRVRSESWRRFMANKTDTKENLKALRFSALHEAKQERQRAENAEAALSRANSEIACHQTELARDQLNYIPVSEAQREASYHELFPYKA